MGRGRGRRGGVMMINSGMHAPIRELGTLFNEGAVGMLSDGRLLDRFVERREASAFEAIVVRYGPLVWGVCRRVLRDHHDAEDAFQATFLVLARKAASVMPREKLGNWLYGVAFQTAMKAMATRAKRRVRERQVRELPEPEAVSDERADELLAGLDREVARLPEKYRMPIILCELQGKTHRQAAEQLGWPVGTVSGRLSRARALWRAGCLGAMRRLRSVCWEFCWPMMWRAPACQPIWSARRPRQRVYRPRERH